jgi:hypothetical protein
MINGMSMIEFYREIATSLISQILNSIEISYIIITISNKLKTSFSMSSKKRNFN